MTRLMDSSSSIYPSPARQSPRFTAISGKIPQWLINARPDTHRALRQAGDSRLDWFAQARQALPEVDKALTQEYALYHYSEQKLSEALAELPALEAFAEPLLVAAIGQRFGLQVDVRNTWLVHAGSVYVDDSFASLSRDPLVELQKSLKAATQTLLHAALQNFEAWETVSGAMDLDQHERAAIYDRYPISGVAVTGTPLAIDAHAFAALCRELDLGGKYQEKITAFLSPPSKPGDAPDAATFNRQGLLRRVEQSAYALEVHVAYMRGDIGEQMYKALLKVGRNFTQVSLDDQPVTCSFLRLWDIELTGIVAIGKLRDDSDQVERVVVYIPDDPVSPLKEYESSTAFTRALRDRMLLDGYLDFFQRFVPARHRAELFAKLDGCLRPRVWNKDRGWYEQQVDSNARLHLRDRSFATGLLTALTTQKIAVLKDDAVFHAVPTADEDQKSRARRLHYFESLALQTLSVVGFVVPPVGAVMMAVAAAQLSHEVFEGVDSWTRGEWQQGWAYLMDVVENVAVMAALVAAHPGATPALETITVETPSFIEELKEVELPNGETRLWKPDLGPFAHDTLLPEDLQPDEFGIYHHEGKTWISVEGKVYSVKQRSSSGQFHVQHPTRALTYEPPLRNNGTGAWLHPADQPEAWEGLKLFRRLGHSAAEFPDSTAQRILRITETHEAVLRRVLVENQRPPALLEDTMRRFQLDQDVQRGAQNAEFAGGKTALFEARYRALSISQEANAAAITRRYPGLPTTIADELVRNASPTEFQQLSQGRVPSRLAEEVRVYQQQVRLTRAYEGLYLESVSNPDSDILILHTLQRLPGWPAELRLELREGWFGGALVDAAGPAQAAVRKVLVKYADGYEPFDGQGRGLHGRDDFYSSILHALPDAARAGLGFPGTWDDRRLKLAVQGEPLLARQTLRALLKMQPTKPGPKSPMRLADDRLGYPLSGHGALQGFIVRETLLDLLRTIGLADPAEQILLALEGTGMSRQQIHQRLIQVLDERNALQLTLNAWGDASASIPDLSAHLSSRNRIHDAIWRHWSENALFETIPTPTALRLENVVLSDFPEALPDFFHQRVSQLELIDVSVRRTTAEAAQPAFLMVDHRVALEQFLRRFSEVTSLEIHRTDVPGVHREPLVFQLPYLIAQVYPRLRTLRLINQGIWISVLDVQSLNTLEHLQWLDLSGNQVSFIAPSNLLSLRLRYLGLDSVDLDSWPSWLDGLPSADIAEVSLRNNRISELPAKIMDPQAPASQVTRISLHGNPLSRLTMMHIRLGEVPGSRFRFSLDIPPGLDAQVTVLRTERVQLQEAIDNSTEASSSTRPLSEATVQARRAIGQAVVEFWSAYSEGRTSTVLTLTGISLADFPRQLPAFFYVRVRNMLLENVVADTSQLNRFLANFAGLNSLELVGQARPMSELPSTLFNLPLLTTLSLRGQGRYVDQQAIALLARLPHIETLDLSGNQLGTITDASGLRGRLRWLSLNNTGLAHWPDWVDVLMPLEGLMLDDNQLTELPEHILRNPRNDDAHTEIALQGNPLSYDIMRRAHVSENYYSSYSFRMDLPADILALPYERHDSDLASGSDVYVSDSDSSGSASSGQVASPLETADVEPWLLSTVDENQLRRALWQRLETAGDATDLMALIGRLPHTAPYRTETTRLEFTERVWRVLEAADQHLESRLLYNGIAQEALVQPETGSQTCHDGAWLVFNQIEIQMFIAQSLSSVPAALRGQSLYRLARRLYRLHELDAVAREQAAGRDEAEVRLAYRLRWSTELDLPLPPGSMLYQLHAGVRPGELDAALARVQQGEHGEPFMQYAAHRDFWVHYLREAYAPRFEVLKQDYLARVVALPDRFPGRAIDELGEEFATLQREFEAQEMNLIRQLTYREGFDQS